MSLVLKKTTVRTITVRMSGERDEGFTLSPSNKGRESETGTEGGRQSKKRWLWGG